MQWFDIEEASFYAACWVVSFFVSLARSAGSSSAWQSLRIGVANASFSGFVSFCGVALLVWVDGGSARGHWGLLAVSALIGAMGPLQQELLQLMYGFVLALFRRILGANGRGHGEEKDRER